MPNFDEIFQAALHDSSPIVPTCGLFHSQILTASSKCPSGGTKVEFRQTHSRRY